MVIIEYPVFDGTNGNISAAELFPDKTRPLKIEIGFGNGMFIFNLAESEPGTNFLGIELYHRGIRSLAKRVLKSGIENLVIIHGDAKKVLARSVEKNQLAEVYINFPDPWPKKRHKKRRLVNVDFGLLLHSKLQDKARVYLATDAEDYGREMLVCFDGMSGYKNMAGRMKFSDRTHCGVTTKYEEKSLSYGEKIYYLQYRVQK